MMIDYNPKLLLKIFTEKDHAESLLKGNLYMRASGYFNALENDPRKDDKDGKCPIDLKEHNLKFVSDSGVTLDFAEISDSISIGFPGDDKVPIFCAVMLDQNALDITEDVQGNYTLRFKKEYAKEILKFGQYAILLNVDEFIEKISAVGSQRDLIFNYGCIKYVDISTYFNPMCATNDTPHHRYFFKDNSYKRENEWRLVLTNKSCESYSDAITIDIGTLSFSQDVFELESFLRGKFQLHKRLEDTP